jgi:hypothetical protein
MDLVVTAGQEPSDPGNASVQRMRTGLNAIVSHQPLDTASANRLTLLIECLVDPRAAIGLPGGTEHGIDLLQECGIFLGS